MTNKTKKFLALSKSSNEYEVATTVAPVAELMIQHQISELHPSDRHTYRCYEAYRNDAGGLDGLSTGWEEITTNTAQNAADQYAKILRDAYGTPSDMRGIVAVATDDDGDSAETDLE